MAARDRHRLISRALAVSATRCGQSTAGCRENSFTPRSTFITGDAHARTWVWAARVPALGEEALEGGGDVGEGAHRLADAAASSGQGGGREVLTGWAEDVQAVDAG
jgi:hypothetical protein